METIGNIQLFVTIAVVWLVVCSLCVICAFTVTIYRTKSLPQLHSIMFIIGSWLIVSLVSQLNGNVDFPISLNFLLLVSVFMTFSALGFAYNLLRYSQGNK